MGSWCVGGGGGLTHNYCDDPFWQRWRLWWRRHVLPQQQCGPVLWPERAAGRGDLPGPLLLRRLRLHHDGALQLPGLSPAAILRHELPQHAVQWWRWLWTPLPVRASLA